jgi:hypothetical protein
MRLRKWQRLAVRLLEEVTKARREVLKAVAVSSSQVTMYYIFTVGDGVTEAMRIRESWIYVEGARE